MQIICGIDYPWNLLFTNPTPQTYKSLLCMFLLKADQSCNEQWELQCLTGYHLSYKNIELFNWQDEDLKLADGLLIFTSYCQ